MELMTIRDFAEDQHVSYEAIRRQLSTYREELREHIIKKGRTQFLDEYAIEFLKGKRREHPVIVVKEDYREEIASLQEEIGNLQGENESLKKQVMLLQQKLIELEHEKNELLEHKIRSELLLELHDKNQKQLQEVQNNLQETKQELTEAKQELNSYSRTWFGLYRKNTK